MDDNGGSCVPALCEDCVTDGGLMVNDIIINRGSGFGELEKRKRACVSK